MVLFLGYLFWKYTALKRLIPNASVRMRMVAQYRTFSHIKHAIIIIAIALFAIAVLRPRWGDEMREASSEGVDVLVALDVSTSMLARDISPSRLDRAKDAVRILAGTLEGDRIGLVLFAGEAFLQCPLTADIEAFHMFLHAASPASVRIPGTDIGAALDIAYRVFNRRWMTSRNFILITDGEDHEGKVNAAIEKFKELDVTVHTLGIGREGGDVIPLAADDPTGDVYQKDTKGNIVRTKRNDDLLRRLAEATGEVYYDINDSFAGVYRIIDRIAAQQRSRDGTQLVKQKKERYAIFALMLTIMLMMELLLPEKNMREGKRSGYSISSLGNLLLEWSRAVFRRNYGNK
jgi:Ca-activated chloride channel family protein